MGNQCFLFYLFSLGLTCILLWASLHSCILDEKLLFVLFQAANILLAALANSFSMSARNLWHLARHSKQRNLNAQCFMAPSLSSWVERDYFVPTFLHLLCDSFRFLSVLLSQSLGSPAPPVSCLSMPPCSSIVLLLLWMLWQVWSMSSALSLLSRSSWRLPRHVLKAASWLLAWCHHSC